MASEVKFEIFRSSVNSWENLFEQAAEFAASIGRENLITISHSSDKSDGVVTVWFWEERDSNVLGLKVTE